MFPHHVWREKNGGNIIEPYRASMCMCVCVSHGGVQGQLAVSVWPKNILRDRKPGPQKV